MKTTWRQAVQDKTFIIVALATLVLLAGLATLTPYFFREVIAPKHGVQLRDPLLAILQPFDLSFWIFALINFSILLTLVVHWKDPRVIVGGFAAYCLITLARMLAMYGITLEPPEGMISLVDPFLTHFFYPPEFAKDLFFSGHVSTMVLMALVEPVRWMRWLKIAAGVAVAACLLIQHVHYSIDVFSAPVFTYAAYKLVFRLKCFR